MTKHRLWKNPRLLLVGSWDFSEAWVIPYFYILCVVFRILPAFQCCCSLNAVSKLGGHKPYATIKNNEMQFQKKRSYVAWSLNKRKVSPLHCQKSFGNFTCRAYGKHLSDVILKIANI